jgi:hypothetical protein
VCFQVEISAMGADPSSRESYWVIVRARMYVCVLCVCVSLSVQTIIVSTLFSYAFMIQKME